MARAPRPLAGKVVAITGGGRGIGRATAEALVGLHARVAIGDIDAPLAERTAGELGGGTIGLALDVTDRRSFAAFLDEVERRLGPLDVLVNNAGIMPIGPLLQESDDITRRMVDVNLHGVMFGSKLALERFLPRGAGHLVNLASVAGKAGFPGGVTYCATKHAVVGLSEAIRAEMRGMGIDVSIVIASGVDTELYAGVPPTRLIKLIRPEAVAAAIVEALQTGRVDVYLPRWLNALFRALNVVPRPVVDLVAKVLRADSVLLHADPTARGAYLTRTSQPPPAPALAAGAPHSEPPPGGPP